MWVFVGDHRLNCVGQDFAGRVVGHRAQRRNRGLFYGLFVTFKSCFNNGVAAISSRLAVKAATTVSRSESNLSGSAARLAKVAGSSACWSLSRLFNAAMRVGVLAVVDLERLKSSGPIESKAKCTGCFDRSGGNFVRALCEFSKDREQGLSSVFDIACGRVEWTPRM